MDPRHLMSFTDDELHIAETRHLLLLQGHDPDELTDPSGRTVLDEALDAEVLH